MGKSWDNTGIANNSLMWKECLRVLKPGGYLLSFGGTRTYHRMAVAIEDAGFEVRDMIEWVYGSGFPKSHNIGLRLDQKLGLQGFRGKETSFSAKVIQQKYVDGRDKVLENGKAVDKYEGKSDIAKQYQGWGTALKPAHEPICMARKPIECKTVAENVLKYGTGGINIDQSRVPTTREEHQKLNDNRKANRTIRAGEVAKGYGMKPEGLSLTEQSPLGRFPANLIHDNSEEVRECFPETKSGSKPGQKGKSIIGSENGETRQEIENAYGDSGNASRFFKSIIYQAKSSKSERNKGCEELEVSEKFTAGNYSQSPTCKDCDLTLNGTNDHSQCSGEVYYKEMESKNTKNNHPTVKPIALMEYLIKMITPKGGTVLDPFLGSGSTGVAAKENGFSFIGIEKEEDYCKIAEARIKNIPDKLL